MAANEGPTPLAAARFRRGRAALADGLAGLLGRGAPAPEGDAARVAALARELRESRDAAARHDWGFVARGWPPEESAGLVEAVHRLGRNLGARPVWAVVLADPPQAVALDSETALDNPLGLAALADEGGGARLALVDPELAAGLWLARGPGPEAGWQLEVWGEPWLSAATRALRGLG